LIRLHWLNLLTLPVRPLAELRPSTERILEQRPDLSSAVFTVLVERFPHLTREAIMEIVTHSSQGAAPHPRRPAVDCGRPTRRPAGGRSSRPGAREATVTLRLLNRRCGPLAGATTTRIQALPLEQLESLAVDAVFSEGVALLDFSGPADLTAWLEEHKG
jgi:hypothetical protein